MFREGLGIGFRGEGSEGAPSTIRQRHPFRKHSRVLAHAAAPVSGRAAKRPLRESEFWVLWPATLLSGKYTSVVHQRETLSISFWTARATDLIRHLQKHRK